LQTHAFVWQVPPPFAELQLASVVQYPKPGAVPLLPKESRKGKNADLGETANIANQKKPLVKITADGAVCVENTGKPAKALDH